MIATLSRSAASALSAPPRSSRSHHCWTGSAIGTPSTRAGQGAAGASSVESEVHRTMTLASAPPLGRHQPHLAQVDRCARVHDGQRGLPPWHEQIRTEIGRERHLDSRRTGALHDATGLVGWRPGAVPAGLGLEQNGLRSLAIEVEEFVDATDVAVGRRCDMVGQPTEHLRCARLTPAARARATPVRGRSEATSSRTMAAVPGPQRRTTFADTVMRARTEGRKPSRPYARKA